MTTIDGIEARIREIAALHGLIIARVSRSAISNSRYISVDRPDGAGFDAGKSARGRFCRETGVSFPRFSPLNVRISDHHGYNEGTNVHMTVRVDQDANAAIGRIDAALALLSSLGA